MNEKDFLFRENFYDCIHIIDEPRIRLAVVDCLLEYGTQGTFDFNTLSLSPEEREEVREITRQMFISIDNTKERYRRAVENGRKGGKMGGRGNKKNAKSQPDNP